MFDPKARSETKMTAYNSPRESTDSSFYKGWLYLPVIALDTIKMFPVVLAIMILGSCFPFTDVENGYVNNPVKIFLCSEGIFLAWRQGWSAYYSLWMWLDSHFNSLIWFMGIFYIFESLFTWYKSHDYFLLKYIHNRDDAWISFVTTHLKEHISNS